MLLCGNSRATIMVFKLHYMIFVDFVITIFNYLYKYNVFEEIYYIVVDLVGAFELNTCRGMCSTRR